mmetsp:Transcript_4914/g.14209  ORF Transcript_4914/g.14209 Transcript_4914/m.14209 type:complete len:210 (+) Transcript_4914:611-1240(+)
MESTKQSQEVSRNDESFRQAAAAAAAAAATTTDTGRNCRVGKTTGRAAQRSAVHHGCGRIRLCLQSPGLRRILPNTAILVVLSWTVDALRWQHSGEYPAGVSAERNAVSGQLPGRWPDSTGPGSVDGSCRHDSHRGRSVGDSSLCATPGIFGTRAHGVYPKTGGNHCCREHSAALWNGPRPRLRRINRTTPFQRERPQTIAGPLAFQSL